VLTIALIAARVVWSRDLRAARDPLRAACLPNDSAIATRMTRLCPDACSARAYALERALRLNDGAASFKRQADGSKAGDRDDLCGQ
jgi:hypothetical protein